jgi:NADH dehydrogenase FAD-containing subunit
MSFAFLVIAFGTVTSFKHAAGAANYAAGRKDGPDVVFLYNRVLTMLEWAETQQDPKARHELLTFVVAGGDNSNCRFLNMAVFFS